MENVSSTFAKVKVKIHQRLKKVGCQLTVFFCFFLRVEDGHGHLKGSNHGPSTKMQKNTIKKIKREFKKLKRNKKTVINN